MKAGFDSSTASDSLVHSRLAVARRSNAVDTAVLMHLRVNAG